MFHWVTGIPFENDLHGGAYDDLTLWEQIDDGAQYTPAKKWLFCVPIGLWVSLSLFLFSRYHGRLHICFRSFLASTHYTNYNPWLFAINLSALIFVLIPKLPQVSFYRVAFLVGCHSGWLNCISAVASAASQVHARRRVRHGHTSDPQFSELRRKHTVFRDHWAGHQPHRRPLPLMALPSFQAGYPWTRFFEGISFYPILRCGGL